MIFFAKVVNYSSKNQKICVSVTQSSDYWTEWYVFTFLHIRVCSWGSLIIILFLHTSWCASLKKPSKIKLRINMIVTFPPSHALNNSWAPKFQSTNPFRTIMETPPPHLFSIQITTYSHKCWGHFCRTNPYSRNSRRYTWKIRRNVQSRHWCSTRPVGKLRRNLKDRENQRESGRPTTRPSRNSLEVGSTASDSDSKTSSPRPFTRNATWPSPSNSSTWLATVWWTVRLCSLSQPRSPWSYCLQLRRGLDPRDRVRSLLPAGQDWDRPLSRRGFLRQALSSWRESGPAWGSHAYRSLSEIFSSSIPLVCLFSGASGLCWGHRTPHNPWHHCEGQKTQWQKLISIWLQS